MTKNEVDEMASIHFKEVVILIKTTFNSEEMNQIKLAPVILSTLMVFTGFQLQAQDGGSSSAVLPDVVLLWALISVAALLVLVNFVLLSTIKGIAADRGVWEVVREKLDRSKGGAAILFLGLMLSGFSANAADGSTEIPFVMSDDLFYALLGINALLLGLVFYQISVLRAIINLMKSEEEVKEPWLKAGLLLW